MKIYVCPGTNCNFRGENIQFEKRFDKKGKVDKREVNKLMKKMKKEAEEFNNNNLLMFTLFSIAYKKVCLK